MVDHTVRWAAPSDGPACRALLPDAFPARGHVDEMVVAEAAGTIVGAGLLAFRPKAFHLNVQVAPAWRNRGIGRALVEAAVTCAKGETRAVRAQAPVEVESAEARLLASCGFRAVQTFQRFESDLMVFAAAMAPLLARAQRRIPSSVRLIRLGEADPDAVARLASISLAISVADARARIVTPGPRCWHPEHSLVLLEGNEVAGAVLAYPVPPSLLHLDLYAVDPAHRGSWAALMLVEGIARLGREAGFQRFRFEAEPHIRDTINLGRRTGATRLLDTVVMERTLWPMSRST